MGRSGSMEVGGGGDGEERAANDPCNDFLRFRATCGNLFPTRYGADVVRIKSSVRPRCSILSRVEDDQLYRSADVPTGIVDPTFGTRCAKRWFRAFAEIVPRFSRRDKTYVAELPINREIYFRSSTYRGLVTLVYRNRKTRSIALFSASWIDETIRLSRLSPMKIFHFMSDDVKPCCLSTDLYGIIVFLGYFRLI